MKAHDFLSKLGIVVIIDDELGKSWSGPVESTTGSALPYPATAQAETAGGEVFDIVVRKVPLCGCGQRGRWAEDYLTYTCCKNLGDGRDA